jgi:hypothetical protein
LRIRGGALHGPNWTWGANLYVGSNGRVDSWAYVVTTDGNLHLDPRNGYSTYLNWYAGGTVYVNSDIRAEIFYDRNDTGYYFGSGSGGTSLNWLDSNNHYIRPGYMLYSDSGGWTGNYNKIQWHSSHTYFNNTNGGYFIHRFGGSDVTYINTSGDMWFAYLGWLSNNLNQSVRTDAGPTFAQVYVNGWYRQNSSNGFYWQPYDRGFYSPEGGGNSYGHITTYSGGRNGWYGYGIGSRWVMMSSGTGSDNFGIHDNNRTWMYVWENGYHRFQYGYLQADGSMRSPIFYDNNDTGYYGDFNSYSQFSNLYTNGWLRPQGCVGLYFQSYGQGIWSVYCEGSPYGHIATYGGGRNGWYGYAVGSRWVMMSTVGDNFGIHDNNRTWMYLWDGGSHRFQYGYTWADGSMRTPIFYDNNDTGYYGDFNSDSRMYRINANYLYAYGWIFAQDNIIAYYSDERLKTKLGPIEDALGKLSKLNGFYYTNNELAKSFGYTEDKVQLGLSAQEVQSVIPEIVHLAPFDTKFDDENNIIGSKTGENYLTIEYDKVVPLLVEAIKEQQKIIENQSKEITEIKEILNKVIFNNKDK